MSNQTVHTVFIADTTEGCVRDSMLPDTFGVEPHSLSVYANAAGVEVQGSPPEVARMVRTAESYGYKVTVYISTLNESAGELVLRPPTDRLIPYQLEGE